MPRLDVLDEEFGEDAAALARARRRRAGARLSMLAGVALGLGAIGALAFAWSNADGRLRFELQSAASPPKNAQRAAEEEIDRLRRQIEALQEDVKELTEAQRQAAYTIATVKAAEQELRRHAPGPYWYSNPEALNPVIAGRPQSAAAAPLPRRAPSPPPPAR
jgi:TolA-binding protein